MRKLLLIFSLLLMAGCAANKVKSISFSGDVLSCQYAVGNIENGEVKFITGATPDNIHASNNQFATTMFSRLGLIESPVITERENGVLISKGDDLIFTMSEDKSNFAIVERDKMVVHQWDKCSNIYETKIDSTEKDKKNIDWVKSGAERLGMECDEYVDSTFSLGEKNNLVEEKSIFIKKRILPNSSRFCTAVTDIYHDDKIPLMVVEKSRINNIDVSIYHSDGSASLGSDYSDKASWSYRCEKDKMNDKVECYMRQDYFFVFKDSGGYTISVGKEHFPGRNVYVRVGKGKPFITGDSGVFGKSSSRNVISSALKNNYMVTRYTEWPYDSPIDKEVNLDYFNDAIKLLDTIYSNYKK